MLFAAYEGGVTGRRYRGKAGTLLPTFSADRFVRTDKFPSSKVVVGYELPASLSRNICISSRLRLTFTYSTSR